MKKKILLFSLLCLFITSGISFCLDISHSAKFKGLLLGNIENVFASPEVELPDEVKIQCLGNDNSTCIVGKYVVPKHYFSEH